MFDFSMSVLLWAVLLILVIVFFVSGNVLVVIRGPKKKENTKSLEKQDSDKNTNHFGGMLRVFFANFLFLIKYSLYNSIVSGVVSIIICFLLNMFNIDDSIVYFWINFVISSLLAIYWIKSCGFYMCRKSFLKLSDMSYRAYSNILLIPIVAISAIYFLLVANMYEYANGYRELFLEEYFDLILLTPVLTAGIVIPLGFMFLRGWWGKRFVCKDCRVFGGGDFYNEASETTFSTSDVYIKGDDVHVGTLRTEGGSEVKVYAKAPGHYEERTVTYETNSRELKPICPRCGKVHSVSSDKLNLWDFCFGS